MADPQSTPADDEDDSPEGDESSVSAGEERPDAAGTDTGSAHGSADSDPGIETGVETEELTTEELRREVEEKYDFEEFGPDQMAEMSAEEWEAAFDPDTWITGKELLDRVEADLKHRVLVRDVFARVERLADGHVVAYSDQGYAAVHPDGSVEGYGTVLRDVKPVVALCSMESYDVPEKPEGEVLPEPAEVPEGSGELGNLVLQVIAGVQILAGLGLFAAWLGFVTGLLSSPTGRAGQDLNLTLLVVAGVGFLFIGIVLFLVVANARLSDRFRAEEFRNRLRAVGVEADEYPDFLPVEDGRWVGGDERGDGQKRGREGERGGESGPMSQ